MSETSREFTIRAVPYQHQRKAAAFALERLESGGGAALLMEMGTGKTLTTIAIVGSLWLQRKIQHLLVVAPLSILGVWEDEFERFAAFGYDEDQLTALARGIIERGKYDGFEGRLIYRMADKGDYILVAFLDNTVILESAGTLINYTLIFGGVALVSLFFLARYLANRIVTPLEESYQRQKQFVSDAGHELKTPVAVVNANLELLAHEIGENQWLSNIRYENERMSALILQLLDLARAENAAPPMEPLDLSRLVCGETLPFETVAYENGLTLNSEIAENIHVDGNSVQLKQLVSILIDNAIRHGGRGKEVSLNLKREKNCAVLSVANDGEEIPPEQRKHLFERFYRTDAARTGEDKHYGLGLAIAKAITQTHKGTIDVHCHDGKVVFTARIPLKREGRSTVRWPLRASRKK